MPMLNKCTGLSACPQFRVCETWKSDMPLCRYIASLFCDSHRIQTCNLLIRSQMLYSVELANHRFVWCPIGLICDCKVTTLFSFRQIFSPQKFSIFFATVHVTVINKLAMHQKCRIFQYLCDCNLHQFEIPSHFKRRWKSYCLFLH